jgi:hypothetical protein
MKERYVIQEDDLEIEPDAIVDTETNTMYECSSIDMGDLCKLLNDYETRMQVEQEQIKEMREHQNAMLLASKTIKEAREKVVEEIENKLKDKEIITDGLNCQCVCYSKEDIVAILDQVKGENNEQ